MVKAMEFYDAILQKENELLLNKFKTSELRRKKISFASTRFCPTYSSVMSRTLEGSIAQHIWHTRKLKQGKLS